MGADVLRRIALCGVIAAGIGSLVASGGGDAPQCSFFSNVCEPVVGPILPMPRASVAPLRATGAVGGVVTFDATVSDITLPTYQWCLQPAGSTACAPIAGATASRLDQGALTLAEDGATVRVNVSGSGNATASAGLRVSAATPAEFTDTEFDPAAWSVHATASPAPAGAWHEEAQASTGGHPGAHRLVTLALPAAPFEYRLTHDALVPAYDPAAAGALYVVDMAVDCVVNGTLTAAAAVPAAPALRQGSRRYVALAWAQGCVSSSWTPLVWNGLGAADFALVDGPACTAGESCPDFRVGAPPLQFGLSEGGRFAAGAQTGSASKGIDNWRVRAWPR